MRSKLIFVFTLVFAFVMLTANAGVAEASTSRVAIINKISGSVEVQKSGGKKTLKGFKNMSLNEGDIVSTGDKSSVELKFSNGTSTDDTLVLESNTTVTFTKLSNRNGNVTKVKMKSGKAWVDVKSIASSSDDFQLETPTAIMGVRGTNFFIGIDPNTGKSVLSMFSGVVRMLNEEDNFNRASHIYPSQISYYNPEEGSFTGLMSNQSIEQLLQNTSPDTMEAILANLKKIQEENERLLESMRDGSAGTNSDDILDNEQIKQNIERLTSALLAAALEKKLLSEEEVRRKQLEIFGSGADVPDSTLETSNRNDQYDFILNQKTQQMLEQLNRQNLAEEKKREMEQKLAEQKRKLEEEKKKREQEALDKYLQNLNSADRDRLLQQREQVERERAQPTPTPRPAAPTPSTPTPPSWNNVAKPITLTHYSYDAMDLLAYSKTNSNELTLSEILLVEEGSSLRFEAANSTMRITSLTINDELLDGDEGIYMWYIPYDAEGFHATIEMNHPVYGNKTFTLSATLQQTVHAQYPGLSVLENQQLTVGQAATLEVTANVYDDGVLSYQWYRSNDDNIDIESPNNGIAIIGATSSSFTVPTNETGTTYYYVVVTNTNNLVNGNKTASTTSNTVQVIVVSDPWDEYTQPIMVTHYSNNNMLEQLSYSSDSLNSSELSLSNTLNIGDGSNLRFEASGSLSITSLVIDSEVIMGNGGIYTWQVLPHVGVINATIEMNHQDYGHKTFNLSGSVYYQEPIVDAATPDIVEVSGSRQFYLDDENASLFVEAETIDNDEGELSYQWYISTSDDPSDGELIEYATDSVYSVPTNEVGVYYYFVVVTNTNSMVNGSMTASTTSNIIEVEVSDPWEQLPFNIVHMDGPIEKENLYFEEDRVPFSYVLVEPVLVATESEELIISSSNEEIEIVGARINGDPLQQVTEQFYVPLTMGWDRISIEIDVRHSHIGAEATYYLTVDTRSAEAGWESIEQPIQIYMLTAEEFLAGELPPEGPRQLSYDHAAEDFYSLSFSEPFFFELGAPAEEGEDILPIGGFLLISLPLDENGEPVEVDYSLLSLTIDYNELPKMGDHFYIIPMHYGDYELDLRIELQHIEELYDHAYFNLQLKVSSEELFTPVQLSVGNEQLSGDVTLDMYEPLYYMSFYPMGEEESIEMLIFNRGRYYFEDGQYLYFLPTSTQGEIEYIKVFHEEAWQEYGPDDRDADGGYNIELIPYDAIYQFKLSNSDQIYEINTGINLSEMISAG